MVQKKVVANPATVKGLTMKEIKQAIPVVFGKLANFGFKDPKALYRVTRLVNKIRPDAIFVEEKSQEIFNKYAQETPDKKTKLVPKESLDQFKKEDDELLAIVSQIEIHPIDFIMVSSDIDRVGLTPNEVINLGRLLVEPTDF